MLYPDFHDLISLKNRKSKLTHRSQKSVSSTISGNHHSSFLGQGLEFDSVREYVPGDDIRNIDWRVTARTGSPHLKIFKQERERHVVLCVDMNAGMRFGTKKTFKSIQAARIASLLGWQGIAQQDRVSACLFGDVSGSMRSFNPQRTRKSLCNILKALTDVPEESNHIPLEKALEKLNRNVHSGSLVYIISDFLSLSKHLDVDPHLNCLNKKCDVIFISVNDRADHTLPPVGVLGCLSAGEKKIYINTNSSSGRESYTAQWKANREHLKEITSRFKIPTIYMTTESDIHHDLVLELKNIAKRKKR